MPDNLPSINLVTNKPTTIDKFIDWTLSIGRLIIIIVELVAITAFIYRFSLDENLTNLHSEIKKKDNILNLLQSDEKKYRNLQERLALVSSISAKEMKTAQTISEISGIIPSQIKITNLNLQDNQVSISVDSISIVQLSDLIESFKKYKNTKSINIGTIDNNPSAGISANITVTLK